MDLFRLLSGLHAKSLDFREFKCRSPTLAAVPPGWHNAPATGDQPTMAHRAAALRDTTVVIARTLPSLLFGF